MTDNKKNQSNIVAKPWNAPKLTVYGTIEELTAGSGPAKFGGQGDALSTDQLGPWESCPCNC